MDQHPFTISLFIYLPDTLMRSILNQFQEITENLFKELL